jgi:hypothetical protein
VAIGSDPPSILCRTAYVFVKELRPGKKPPQCGGRGKSDFKREKLGTAFTYFLQLPLTSNVTEDVGGEWILLGLFANSGG